MSSSPGAATRRTLLLRWLLVIAIIVIVAGGIGGYYLLTSDEEDACAEFHEAVLEQYFPGEAIDPGHRERLIEAIYRAGQFTTPEGEVVTKPEGCEPP